MQAECGVGGRDKPFSKEHRAEGDFGLRIADFGFEKAQRMGDNFEFRNWEPARRVGVRRTISKCGFS